MKYIIFSSPDAPTNIQINYDGQVVQPEVAFTVEVGDNITCSVSSFPEAVMKWEHVSGPGPASPETNNWEENVLDLIATSDMVGDQTTYKCVAEGDGEIEEEDVTFNVVRK